MKKNQFKKEFDRVCKEIKQAGLAKIIVFKKKSFTNKNIGGWVVIKATLPVIYLEYKNKQSYEQLLYYLLHEVGHIIDYRKYSKSKRWKIASRYEYDTNVKKASEYPNKIKFELLRTEAIAENYIKILLKRYNVSLSSDTEIKAQYNQSMFAVLFEFAYGKSPTETERWIIRSMSENYLKLNPQDLRNFIKNNGELFKSCFTEQFLLPKK